MDALRQGNTNVNDLTNKVFFTKHPELNPKTSLKQEQTTLVREWAGTKSLLSKLMPSIMISPLSPTTTPSSSTTVPPAFEDSLKPTLDLKTVITRAREIIGRLNVSGKPNEKQKRRIINIYNCLLNKVQDPNVRDFYIAFPDYEYYRRLTYGGASQSDLMKEGFIDTSGNWIKFRYVRDFLRKPVYFDYNKTDEQYLTRLESLYNEIDETMTNIRQYLEQREAGGQAPRIQQLALFISKEGKNNHSIYSCWG